MAGRFAGFIRLSSVVLGATVSIQPALRLIRFQTPSYCSNEPKEASSDSKPVVASKTDIIESSVEQDDEAWEAEKQKCSFCRMFLASPCRLEFKGWSKCVDAAKSRDEDFVSVCSQFTKALMECSSENDQYFAALREQTQAEDDEESKEDEDGRTAEAMSVDESQQKHSGVVVDDSSDTNDS